MKGWDTFEGLGEPEDAWYPLEGSFATEAEAQMGAKTFLDEHEMLNPTATSGGQGARRIQDRAYIVRPDRSSYRFIPSPELDLRFKSRPAKKKSESGSAQK